MTLEENMALVQELEKASIEIERKKNIILAHFCAVYEYDKNIYSVFRKRFKCGPSGLHLDKTQQALDFLIEFMNQSFNSAVESVM